MVLADLRSGEGSLPSTQIVISEALWFSITQISTSVTGSYVQIQFPAPPSHPRPALIKVVFIFVTKPPHSTVELDSIFAPHVLCTHYIKLDSCTSEVLAPQQLPNSFHLSPSDLCRVIAAQGCRQAASGCGRGDCVPTSHLELDRREESRSIRPERLSILETIQTIPERNGGMKFDDYRNRKAPNPKRLRHCSLAFLFSYWLSH